MPGEDTPVGLARASAYAGPALPVATALYAVTVVMPGLYTEVLGATAVGGILLATRLLDVGFDVGVGVLSDRTPARRGGRRIWVAAGAVVMAAAFAGLASPWAAPAAGAQLLLGLLGFYLGWSMLVVPHNAWGSDLATGYDARSRLFAVRAGAGYLGSIVFALLPALPIFPHHDYGVGVLRLTAVVVAVLLAVTVPAAILWAPERRGPPGAPPRLLGLGRVLARNRPLQIYAAATVLNGLSNGMFIAVVYLYQTAYMGYADRSWLIILVYIGASLVALPAWSVLMQRIGKTRAWALGLGVAAASYPPMALLAPGPASLPGVLAIFAVAGAAFSVSNVATPAVLSDVADYEAFRGGSEMTGTLFALQALIDKFNTAVGAGGAFLIIGAFGYVAGAPLGPQAVTGLKLTHLYLPSLLNVAAIALIWIFPLDARRHATIVRWSTRHRLEGLR